jgi:pimeloyl-ACP methyl ester carboxylesterase
VSQPTTTTVEVNGFPCRVWTKGSGPKLGFLAGFGGLPRWVPFLDELAKSRTVIVPSLPGYPGGAQGHTTLDSHLDWLLAVRQLLSKAGLAGADLLGASVGGSFAAETAAVFPDYVKKLALIAPFGLFDEAEPAADPWAQRKDNVPALMCADPKQWEALVAPPEGANSIEWPIEMTRAAEAAARAFWPLGNTKLEKRLPLIEAPTLVLWGEADRLLPPSYAKKFATGINGGINGSTRIQTIPNAGHLAYLDQPEAVAKAVLGHFS